MYTKRSPIMYKTLLNCSLTILLGTYINSIIQLFGKKLHLWKEFTKKKNLWKKIILQKKFSLKKILLFQKIFTL